MTKTTEKGWAIAGVYGLYTGWSFTRREAIRHHVESLSVAQWERATGRAWKECRKKGDRAVKVTITYEAP